MKRHTTLNGCHKSIKNKSSNMCGFFCDHIPACNATVRLNSKDVQKEKCCSKGILEVFATHRNT